MSLRSAPPKRLGRWLLRAPLLLYRTNLGWVLGHRFACLSHRGRRTGRMRQTVIEVVRYDPRTREVVVAAGWGGRTDWYRNIQASPALEIRTGAVAYRPDQRFLAADELHHEVQRYVCRHPWIARYLLPRLLGLPVDAQESQRRAAIASTLRGVSFRPRVTGGARNGWISC